MLQVFFSNVVLLPFLDDAVADGGEQDLHDQLSHGTRQGAHSALEGGPVKAVPKNGQTAPMWSVPYR